MTKRKRSTAKPLDAPNALRASPAEDDILSLEGLSPAPSEADEFEPSEEEAYKDPEEAVPVKKKRQSAKGEDGLTPLERAQQRPPAVNTDIVPIPWKGRLGYACLNTYLRTSNPPIFCSRTCRIETVLKYGPWPAGLEYVQSLGLTNAKDLVKIIRWNEKYGIKFLRISSEMFPFASHKEYGYSLEFAKEPLEEAGRVAMELGHRLTVHPGQFTQIGSPRKEVVEASVRDLEYHSQLLRLLGLKGQADKDAVMILHMGGVYGDKAAALERFEENYKTLLSDDIKARLVLENDDVSWSVHDLMPTCKKLNIPLVLDYHHHNIIHDPSVREGTQDVLQLFPEITETWTKKGITQKQHYSEPRDEAITDRDRRKHSARVKVLPPCANDMDLMIEAKDKEQAVFELYKTYGIGGDDLFREVLPHERTDENKPPKKTRKKKGQEQEVVEEPKKVPEEEVGMGGSERRVYWPEGKEEWLSPVKRTRKKKPEEEGGAENEPNPNRVTRKKVKPSEVPENEAAPGRTRKNVAKGDTMQVEAESKPVRRRGKPRGTITTSDRDALAAHADGEVEVKPTRRGRKPKQPALMPEKVLEKEVAKPPNRKKRKTVTEASVASSEEVALPAKSNGKRATKRKSSKAEPIENAEATTEPVKKTPILLPVHLRRGRSATSKPAVPPILTPRSSTPLSEPPETDDEEEVTEKQAKVFDKVDRVTRKAII